MPQPFLLWLFLRWGLEFFLRLVILLFMLHA
jgi:hypothetical protein